MAFFPGEWSSSARYSSQTGARAHFYPGWRTAAAQGRGVHFPRRRQAGPRVLVPHGQAASLLNWGRVGEQQIRSAVEVVREYLQGSWLSKNRSFNKKFPGRILESEKCVRPFG